jgi:hypothetical protein
MVYAVKKYTNYPKKSLVDPVIRIYNNQIEAQEKVASLRQTVNIEGDFYIEPLEKYQMSTRNSKRG